MTFKDKDKQRKYDRERMRIKRMKVDQKPYSKGEQNIITDEYQVIRMSEGCPHNCPWCRETKENGRTGAIYPLPEIVRNDIRITDMNLLSHDNCLDIINQFHDLKVNNHVVYPWLVCGIDYRFLTKEIAEALKYNRFIKIHIAWDGYYKDVLKIKNSIKILRDVGYSQISIFMICNHEKITYEECLKKLNVCKYWNCQINDCWYDNQSPPKIKPIGWKPKQIKTFRRLIREHNIYVRHGYNPEDYKKMCAFGSTN